MHVIGACSCSASVGFFSDGRLVWSKQARRFDSDYNVVIHAMFFFLLFTFFLFG